MADSTCRTVTFFHAPRTQLFQPANSLAPAYPFAVIDPAERAAGA